MMFADAQPLLSRKNPFEEPLLPKAFYHPGSPKKLSKAVKKTVLSPNPRADNTCKSAAWHTDRSVSDEMFLSGAHQYSAKLPRQEESPKDSSSKFDESWPSSERPTSPGEDSVRDSQFDFDQFLNLKQRLEFPEKDSPVSTSHRPVISSAKENETRESTLSKYVERFRRGEPMSRTDRQKVSVPNKRDFWWLSSSPSTSDTALGADTQGTSHLKAARPRSPGRQYMSDHRKSQLTHAALASHTSSQQPIDEETKRLQERTQRLLENSFLSDLSSGPIVSTEGLGSSPSSASLTTASSEERPYRPKFTQFIREKDRAPQMAMPQSVVHVPLLRGGPLRPEDDVLYQWRLKRKMEVAQDSAHFAPTPQSLPVRQYNTEQTHGNVEAPGTAGMESKLAEFRQRLAGSLQPHQVQTSSIQFTPAPTRSVQTTESQTEPKYTVEALSAEAREQSAEEVTTGKRARETADPPIASPTLHRKQKVKVDDPHLHLMCDILPCPHQEDYAYSGRPKTRGKADSSNSDSDSDIGESSKDKQLRYKQYLEAEKPDSEKKLKRGRKDRFADSLSRGASKQEIYGESSTKALKGKDRGHSLPQDEKSKENSENRIPPRLKGQQGDSGGKKLSVGKNAEKPVIPDQSDRTSVRQVERSRRGKTLEVTLPQPKHSSSPKVSQRGAAPIESAIGQVVKDHLFDVSESIVTSSMESLPTSCISMRGSTGGRTLQTDIEEVSSDGEKFTDDSLLLHLRKQRSVYESQLRQIDNLLSDLEGDGCADESIK